MPVEAPVANKQGSLPYFAVRNRMQTYIKTILLFCAAFIVIAAAVGMTFLLFNMYTLLTGGEWQAVKEALFRSVFVIVLSIVASGMLWIVYKILLPWK